MNSRSRYTRNRAFSAIILLMVMMLQVGVKSLHQHHYAEREHIECSDCEHHRVHSGHFLNWNDSDTDCAICQLFSSPFCEAKSVQLNVVPVEHLQPVICSVAAVISTEQIYIIPRAPPVGLL